MKTNLFKPASWSGEFFFPDSSDSRFHGRLEYSPESGIILSYMLLERETYRESCVLHGILDTGDPCTLFGRLPFPMNSTVRNGVVSRNWRAGFPLMAIGGFLDEDQTVTEIDFTLTTLQEFFYPTGFKDSVKFSTEPLYSVRVPFGVLEVGHSAQFTMLPKDIEAIIYSHEPEALKKLSEAFSRVSADHPEAFFALKKDIEYRLIARFAESRSIRDAYQEILNISNLFSILLYSPVYPDSIQFYKENDDSRLKFDLYPSMVVDPRTIELCKNDRFHFHMPITQRTIPLDAVIERWFREPQRYSVIVSALQGETGFRDKHSTHGELLLYATHLESISFSEGEIARKYAYPLEAYACPRIRERIVSAFGVDDVEEAGEAISDLRNEIAHVGRPRTWLATLDLSSLVRIAHCLQLVVLAHILKQLGIPEKVNVQYQEAFCPDD